MRQVLFSLIALGALAWMSAPASADQYRGSRGYDRCGTSQGGHDHGASHGRGGWRRFVRWQQRFSRDRHDYGGGRQGNRGDSRGSRY